MDKERIELMRVAAVESRKQWDQKFVDFVAQNPGNLGQYLRLLPKAYKRLWFRAHTGDLTRAAAVKAKCIDCSGYQKEEVTNCQVSTCPLHKYRPYQKPS